MDSRLKHMKYIKDVSIVALVTFILLALADRLLGMLGFPDEVPIQVSHPSNFAEERSNYEFKYAFKTNSMGLRYREIPLEKNNSEYRVLLLGDSFVEGAGVESAETFGAQLEKQLQSHNNANRQIQFINGGLSGRGPLEYWRLFINVGLKYNPDTVLIGLMGNDVENMPENLDRQQLYASHQISQRSGLRSLLHAIFPHFYIIVSRATLAYYTRHEDSFPALDRIRNHARRLRIPEDAIYQWESSLPKEIKDNADHINEGRVAFGLLRPNFLANNLDIDSPKAKLQFESMILALDEIVKVAQNKKLRVGIIYIPFDYQYDPRKFSESDPWIATGMHVNREWLYNISNLQQLLSKWATDRMIDFHDLTPVFRKAISANPQTRLSFRIDGHWTSSGHSLAAKSLESWLIERDLIAVK